MKHATQCIAALLLLTACGAGTEREWRVDRAKEGAMGFELKSPAFDPQGPIPARHTGEGPDVSPPLEWEGVPEGTAELALICDDPDAPRPTPWVHWVLYGIPASATSLAEGVEGIGVEGKNDFGRSGYGGPMPPPGHGTHHYHFKLYALEEPLDLPPGATKDEVVRAMEGIILAAAELVGTYERE